MADSLSSLEKGWGADYVTKFTAWVSETIKVRTGATDADVAYVDKVLKANHLDTLYKIAMAKGPPGFLTTWNPTKPEEKYVSPGAMAHILSLMSSAYKTLSGSSDPLKVL